MTSFNNWKEWNILPINSVVLRFDEDVNKVYEFFTLEAGTEFRFKLQTDENDLGTSTPICFIIEGNLSVVQNNYKNFKQFYIDVINSKLTRLWIKLHSEENDSNRIIDINGSPQYGQTPRTTLELENYSIIPDITFKRPSPVLNLNILGYLDTSIINTHYDLFIQQSWS
ncbi:MAG: hypothetical protein KIT33_15705 [Candidatus Kapabacteria bacterium]|nr:hypothetical protein [Ignavibacteriota bacterium]MCW5886416.1 hypothetical protein [Candidatus Kapabacteria bacterium]